MGSAFTGQSGFDTAMGQQVQLTNTGASGSSASSYNPFMQQTQDPYSSGNTGFNYGQGSYDFQNAQTPNFTAGNAGSGGQMMNAQQLQQQYQSQPQQQQPQNFMQQFMSLYGNQPQYQNLQGAQNPGSAAGLQAAAPPQNAAQNTITQAAAPKALAANATAGTKAIAKGGPTTAATTPQGWSQITTGANKGDYQRSEQGGAENEVYNPHTGQYEGIGTSKSKPEQTGWTNAGTAQFNSWGGGGFQTYP